MTSKRAFKRRVRARAARTGESYTAALRHFRSIGGATVPTPTSPTPTTNNSVRLAVAQTTARSDPAEQAAFQAAGGEIRSLMQSAHDQGAELILFPEAALCFPDKHRLSRDPDRMAEADWSRFAWQAQRAQLDQIAGRARGLRLWTVIGAVHPAAGPDARPQTSLYVFDPQGREHARYAERLLSRTKKTFMYEPGRKPVSFDVNGLRFGCASGLEVLFPELFSDYEAEGVDCVLFGTAGPGPADHDQDSLARPAVTNAQLTGLWIGYATSRDDSLCATSGIIAPGGGWAARCPEPAEPAIAVTDITARPNGGPRDWRREMLNSYREQLADAGS